MPDVRQNIRDALKIKGLILLRNEYSRGLKDAQHFTVQGLVFSNLAMYLRNIVQPFVCL